MATQSTWGQYPLSFILIKWTQKFRMNPKLFLVAALACLFVDFSSATFPLTFASNGIWASPAGLGTASVADAVAPTVAVSGGVVLLGALGLTIGKALLLRRLTGRGRKRRSLSEISDAEAAAYITQLLAEYEQAVQAEY